MPQRYHPVLVALHWIVAAMVIVALFGGLVILEDTPNSDPSKIGSLRIHMILGGIVLLLTIVRLVVRLRTAHPPEASSGFALADALAPWAHRALYLLVFLMAGSGVTLSVMSGLPDAVFGNAALPASFEGFAARAVHGATASLLIVLILAHVAAALYHQFVRRDDLMARMRLRNK